MITNKNSVRTLVAASSALVALAFSFSFSFTLPALAAPVLKGNVQEQNKINPDQNAPGLSRSDMNSGGDPFGNTQTEQALAPPSFDVENALPPAPPKKAFGLNANQDGNTDDFDPRMMSAVPDQLRQQQAPMPLETTTPGPQMQPQDPDMAPEMQLAWDAWHKQVAAAVYQRYTALSNAIAIGPTAISHRNLHCHTRRTHRQRSPLPAQLESDLQLIDPRGDKLNLRRSVNPGISARLSSYDGREVGDVFSKLW